MKTQRPNIDARRVRARALRSRRRGMALLVVLLLLSVTVGLSYAMMRSQSTASLIQRNADRRASARQAAITGLTMALKKMHRNDWAGVGTSLSGTVNPNETFLAVYTAGDPRLAAGDANGPYRVTIQSTGYAADPFHPSNIAIYRVRAIVHLVPRKLADDPADWQTMMNFTFFQPRYGDFTMDFPVRIEGPVRIQSIIEIDQNYSWWGPPRDNYHKDLERMRIAGKGDYRPFSGNLTILRSWQYSDTFQVLRDYLGLSVSEASLQTFSGMNYPSTISTYQLYTGGPTYAIPQLPQTIQAAVYQPDAATNPAGLFFRSGTLELGDDATIRGTLVTSTGNSSRININGKRVRLEAVSLPPLQGTSDPVQLPVVMAGENFVVRYNAEVDITGLVAANYDYNVLSDDQYDIRVTHQGKLIARNVYFNGRSDWDKWSSWWDTRYSTWRAQKDNTNGIKYFPEWLKINEGLDFIPRLTLKPSATPIRYHWHNPQYAIYVAHPDDGGLRWDLLDWTEQP